MRIIDLSPPVDTGSPVWPGDSPFELAPKWSIDGGDSVSVGTVTTTTHVGAHIDAPAHIVAEAPTVDATPLDACVGPCLVVDVSDLVDYDADPHGQVAAQAVHERVCSLTRDTPAADAPVERLLLRHYAEPQRDWDPALPGIDPALMRWFAAQGGRLLGIDLASFDPAESKELAAHRVGIEHGVVLLEGLDLCAAPEGEAELIALPLRWVGADASPVRAVLRTPDSHHPTHDAEEC